jgi:endonuclease/exonuclease/phosphatase family metal-dependent hydrolase
MVRTLASGLLLAFTAMLAACGAPPVSVAAGAATAPAPLRVVTFNIRAGTDMARQPSMERLGDFLDSLRVDIVFLQEVDSRTRRSGGVDQLAVLAGRTALNGFFAPAMDFDGGHYGTAVLSRFPLREARAIPLPVVRAEELRERYYEPRALLHAVAETPAGPVHLLGTHLDHGREPVFRHTQMLELLAHVADAVPAGVPVLFGGDLNAPPERPEIRALGLHFRDAWELCGGGDGYTFPADTPVRRIDYLLLRGFGCARAEVVPTLVSDHRPLVVTVTRERP